MADVKQLNTSGMSTNEAEAILDRDILTPVVSDPAVTISDPPESNGPESYDYEASLLTHGPADLGPYMPALHTSGDEFWESDLAVSLADNVTEPKPGEPPVSLPMQLDNLNAQNSYVGYYHIRNYGTLYQVIVPTAEATDNYSGRVLYTKSKWFHVRGFPLLSEKAATEGNAPKIRGCKDPNAINYNPLATHSDGSCVIVHSWLLGEIPTNTLNNLYTTGGELYYADTQDDYQGYYHVNGAEVNANDDSIVPGSIMTGQFYYTSESEIPSGQSDNRLLLPYSVGNLVAYDSLLPEEPEAWNFLHINTTATDTSLENQNMQALDSPELNIVVETLDETVQGQETWVIDNKVTVPEPVDIMAQTSFEFLDENIREASAIYSPGIFGTKPQLDGDLNILELKEPVGDTPAVGQTSGIEVVRDEDVPPNLTNDDSFDV